MATLFSKAQYEELKWNAHLRAKPVLWDTKKGGKAVWKL